MALNKFEIKDYLKDLRSKVTFAFEDAPVFDKYLQLLVGPSIELQEVLRELMQERSIDTAVGVQLDIIGNIVGQPRELIDTAYIPYFGYEGAPEAQSYGDFNNPSLGGYYWDMEKSLTGNVLLNDDQYRIFIKAKILKNVTRATPEDVIKFIKFVFGATIVQITWDQDAEQALIMVSDDLTSFELALLKYFVEHRYKSYFVPKSLGIGYEYGSVPAVNPFSYAGVPGGLGFGTYDSGTVTGGGKYASIN